MDTALSHSFIYQSVRLFCYLVSVHSWRSVLWLPFNPSTVSLLTLGEKILVIYL